MAMGTGRHADDFWAWLDTFAPALTDVPADRVLDLVTSDERPVSADPIEFVAAELGREPTMDERAMVLAKVLAPPGTALPGHYVLRALRTAARRPNPWPVAVAVGAGTDRPDPYRCGAVPE